jgi:hypothetical protein
MADTVRLGEVAHGAAALELTAAGAPLDPVVLVDLDSAGDATAATRALAQTELVTIGVTRRPVPAQPMALLDALTLTLATGADLPTCVAVDDPYARAAQLAANARAHPYAAIVLAGLLRVTAELPVREGLIAESLAYSMLLAGPEFHAWRADRPVRAVAAESGEPVLLTRDGGRLEVVLNRPRRHNAYDRILRDALVAALDLAARDDSIIEVRLRGNGPSFCSGGDLDEFGRAPDLAAAHLIRIRQSAGAAVHRMADKVRVRLHGACIGAGVEIPAFAGRVEATADAYVQLPELRMGLVPGAGGTVSITRRIGRWRTAFLALSGEPVDAATALAWGLVDHCV